MRAMSKALWQQRFRNMRLSGLDDKQELKRQRKKLKRPRRGLVWLVDDQFNQKIFDRVKPHLPQELDKGKLAGINARWRIYRYDQGSVYRPHIDGAWPGSGLSKDGKSCVFDAYGDRWSRLTFLIYLNEGFEGGETIFYSPSTVEDVLDARGVSPRVGNVLVFPHGDESQSLIHEGSAVTRGTKYVIRSDVLYYKKILGEKKGRT